MSQHSRIFLLLQCMAVMMMVTSVQGKKKSPHVIIIERVECSSNKYVTSRQCRVARFNSTFMVANASFTYHEDVSLDTEVDIDAFQMMPSGRYSMLPLKFPAGNLCRVLAEEKYFYPDIVVDGNLPRKCPWKAGYYYVNNFYVRSERLPEKLPGERWRFDVLMKHGRKTVWKMSAYLFIDRK